MLDHSAQLLQSAFNAILFRPEAGSARPLPKKIFEMRGELVAAFRYLQSGKAIGKVVVRVDLSLIHI